MSENGASIERDAELAHELLNNDLLIRILAELDTDAVRVWRNGANPEQRELAWHEMMAVQRLGAKLKGRLESKQLADARKR